MTPVEALQTALAAEHAALFVYATLGARTPEDQTALRTAVEEAYDAHRRRRDDLEQRVREAGGDPVAAEATYALPGGAVAAAAGDLEDGCAQAYAWLVAQTVGRDRRWAVEALTDAAVRVLAFRGSPEIFPGAGEHADR